MTRSIFDPTGPDTERSGSTFTGPDAADRSHMPPNIVDGSVDAKDAEELDEGMTDTSSMDALKAAGDELTGSDTPRS